jgi:hypothetical protein
MAASDPTIVTQVQLINGGSVLAIKNGGTLLLEAGAIVQGPLPANISTIFGGSASGALLGAFNEEGNLYRAIGNPLAGNGADATDDIIGGIVIPAGAFDIFGRGLNITAAGKTGATANAGKEVKLWLNPTMVGQTVTNGVISGGTVSGAGAGVMIADSAAQAGNAIGWSLNFNLFKYGAAGANTQYSQGSFIFGATHSGITVPVFSTIAENALINLVVTGKSAQSGANDIVLNFFEINAMN